MESHEHPSSRIVTQAGRGLVVVGIVFALAAFAAGTAPVGADVPAGVGDTWRATDGTIVASSISAGPTHSCAVTTSGAAYCWGVDTAGQLGNGAPTAAQPAPSEVVAPAGVSWASITAGVVHTCAVTTTGVGYCWGDDFYGELGDGAPFDTDHATPAMIDTPSGASWAVLSAGYYSTCGVTTSGDAYCWGNDSSGKLGNGPDGTNQPAPIAVTTPAGVTWASISTGPNDVCARTTAGAAYCWGFGGSGELGNGMTTPVDTPALVVGPSGVRWAMVSVGLDHACGVTTTGVAYCWGSDARGQLGNGSAITSGQVTPAPVATPAGVTWTRLTPGSSTSCGVTTTGAGYCWGDDSYGQLGIGTATITTAPSPSPVPAPPGAGWESIVVDGAHSCGLATDGLGYCWGNDEDGQLGNDAAGSSTTPSRVGEDQSLTVPALPTLSLGASVTVSGVSASSGLGVGATSTSPTICTVNGGGTPGAFVIAASASGTCTVRFTQPGDARWHAAPGVTWSFDVAAAATSSTTTTPPATTTPTTTTATTTTPTTTTATTTAPTTTAPTAASPTAASPVDPTSTSATPPRSSPPLPTTTHRDPDAGLSRTGFASGTLGVVGALLVSIGLVLLSRDRRAPA